MGVLAMAPISGSVPQPVLVFLDWQEGHYEIGHAGPLQQGINGNTWTVWIDDCHRRIWVDLLYDPQGLGAAGLFLPYDFYVEVSTPANVVQSIISTSGHGHFLGELGAGGAATVTLKLVEGALVDWSFRVRGWEVPGDPACQRQVWLNEVEVNAGTGSAPWVELHNAATWDIDVGDWMLESTVGEPQRFVISAASFVPRQGVLVVDLPPGFFQQGGDAVRLLDEDGRVADESSVLADADGDSRTWQRVPDGRGEWIYGPSTRGALNE